MTIIDFPLSKKEPEIKHGPCKVVFHSSSFRDTNGNEKSINVAVTIEDGDFHGIINSVIETGGIWGSSTNGEYFFLPWPCASVELFPV